MATQLMMPRLSDTMTTGKVLSWQKKIGDKIAPGDVLAEIESDKATMEFEAFEEGTLLEILVPAGESAPIGAVLAVLGEAGETVTPIPVAPKEEKPKEEKKPVEKVELKSKKPVKPEVKEVVAPPTPVVQETPAVAAPVRTSDRIVASPVAMRLAAEQGIDIRTVTGTGPEGRITRSDIETAVGKAPAPRPVLVAAPAAPTLTSTISKPAIATPTTGNSKSGTEPLSQMRTAIARRMTDGWQAPMFTVTVEVNMGRVLDLRSQWKEAEGEAPSINDFIVSACARALHLYPSVNASFGGDHIAYHATQDIGVAVALDDGLITPVIRDARNLTLREIASESKRLAQKAKDRKLQLEEFSGSTFTISNLGMFDVAHFTAIVNPPEAAILAVGSVRETAVVRNGDFAIENIMAMTISGDHRVIDGATGAKFLGEVKRLLELPVILL